MRWTKDEEEMLIRLAKTHNSTQIGKQLGRSASTIRQYASRLGISLRKHGELHPGHKYSNNQIGEVMRLALAGYSSAAISQLTGVKENYVIQVRSGNRRWRDTIHLETKEGT